MALESAFVLVLALPWLVFAVLILRRQREALAWLEANVGPRFLHRLTRSSRRSLFLQVTMLAIAGLLLLVAAAGPTATMTLVPPNSVLSSTVVVVLDASLSMGANDGVRVRGSDEEPVRRFNLAKTFVTELVAAMPETAVALISFSGDAVIHSPPTRDRHALTTLLRAQRYHIYGHSVGTRFSTAFDAVLHMMRSSEGRFQVVLLSDGELSVSDDYDDGVALLAKRGVPIHTVGVGSRTWQEMVVYDLNDVINGVEEKEVVAEYSTRRESKELERMSEATDGLALVLEDGLLAEELAAELWDRRFEVEIQGQRQKSDQGHLYVAAFLVLFLIETLFLGRRRWPSSPGPPPWASRAGLLFLLLPAISVLSGCNHPLLRAHWLNEKGVQAQRDGDPEGAAALFERSAAYGVKEHIPTYNLAATWLERGDVTSAHQVYEEALRLEPRLAEAHYNDGHVLYLWGQAEIDPSGCELERTRALWEQAMKRFERVVELEGADSDLGAAAEENRAVIEQAFGDLDHLAEQCPSSSGAPQGESGSEGDGGEPPPPLTGEEEQEVAEALARAREEAESAADFRQSRHQQLSPDAADAAEGKKIWW